MRAPRVLAASVAAACIAPSSAAAECTGSDQPLDSASPSDSSAAVQCLINERRADRGLRAVRADAALVKAARAHNTDMLATARFSHTGSNGSSPAQRIRRTGYLRRVSRWVIGEVLAREPSAGTPRTVVRAWMNSAEHRDVLLDGRFRQIGIAARVGGPMALTTADFGVAARRG